MLRDQFMRNFLPSPTFERRVVDNIVKDNVPEVDFVISWYVAPLSFVEF